MKKTQLSAQLWFDDFTYVDSATAGEIELQCYEQGYLAFIDPHPEIPNLFVFHTLYYLGRDGIQKKKIAARFGRKSKKYSYVYFLLSPTLNRVKIGTTNQLSYRIQIHQTSAPEPLVFLGSIRCTKELNESIIHKQFFHLRRHLEWFEGTKELLDWIKEATKSCSLSQLTN